jgi:hypothetical protein
VDARPEKREFDARSATTTVNTVGYGRPAVTTDDWRIIAICQMVTGIGFVAILTAAAAERFVRSRCSDSACAGLRTGATRVGKSG